MPTIMPLASGTKLGSFEILSPLGAGGMGEVYRAKDTRLGRVVAIKVLPEHLSHKPDIRQRLENEARTISQLSHPNICTLHDIGNEGATHFLVLEFVEGETLRHALAAGRLATRKIISIAVQAAEGLAKAHETGIVHRDLKPENLMVSGDAVKILDFGLAKLDSGFDQQTDNSVTSLHQTRPGTVLGTVGYMSPEQATGRTLDFRSDQFSFGLILYEMATGIRPFHRKTATQTLLAIVQEEPAPIASINPEIPPPFCWVVERCLAKEPGNRYSSRRDLARDLIAIRDRLSDLQHKATEIKPSNLPAPITACVGREKEIAAVKELLLRSDVRLVTVTGPGGIGKSRLALEIARDLGEFFPSGIYFVSLGAVGDPQLIHLVIAQALGLRETGGQSPSQSLQEFLRNSLSAPLLLLIDNFEHVIAAAPLLAELLSVSPNLKLLVTSRAALHVYHEQEFPVPPLALPDSKSMPSLEMIVQSPAIALFVQRAAAVKPNFVLTEDNAAAVAEICARLDGLPLAIELAAARAKLLSPAAMCTRLASRLQLLTGGARDLPTRQQTLRQAIDWSYDLLTEAEQKLFRRLSVFQGGCTLEAVESVCDTKEDLGLDVLDGMASMVDKSLVRQMEQADGEPRFVMLETIREYGMEKMAASGERAATLRAHAAYCLVLAEEGAAEDSAKTQNAWLERLALENDNFRAALEWLTETNDVHWAWRLGAALFRFWEARERFGEGRDQLAKLLQLEGAAQLSSARLRVLFAAGVLAGAQGDYVAAIALIEQSLEIARQLDDKRSMAVSINALAVITRDRGDLTRARELFEECLALWRDTHDELAVARTLSNLANVVKLQADYVHARTLCQECQSIFMELGDKTGEAWALNHQGDVARLQGEASVARSLYQQSLAKFRELGDRWGIAGTLADLGGLSLEQKEYRSADALYRESLEIFRQLEHKRGVARLLESFAGSAAALRESIGAPLSPLEQAKFERSVEPARAQLTTPLGRTAWLEGWVMPVDLAIEDVLHTSSCTGSTGSAGSP